MDRINVFLGLIAGGAGTYLYALFRESTRH